MKAAFKTQAEAETMAAHLNATKYKRSRIGVKVIRMNPFWVLAGCGKTSLPTQVKKS